MGKEESSLNVDGKNGDMVSRFNHPLHSPFHIQVLNKRRFRYRGKKIK